MGGRGTSSLTQGKENSVNTISRTKDNIDRKPESYIAPKGNTFNNAQRRKERRTILIGNDGSSYPLSLVRGMNPSYRKSLGLKLPEEG